MAASFFMPNNLLNEEEFLQKVESLKKEQKVEAIALIGSYSQGVHDKWSDIDLYVLVAKGAQYYRTRTYIDETGVDIIFNTQDEVLKYLSFEKGATHRNTAHMIVNGKLLWQKKAVWKKIQAIAKATLRSKTKIDHNEIIMHLYSINDYLQKAARASQNGDEVAFALASRLVIDNALEILLKKNNSYWQPLPRMGKFIESLDPKFYKLLASFYSENKIQKSFSILSRLSEHAVHVVGRPLPATWSIKR